MTRQETGSCQPRRTPCGTFSAVVKPSGAVPWKKRASGGFAGTSTMVVPLPYRFELALKLDTRTSPGLIVPPAEKLCGTKATPYGFRSPLDQEVDTTRTGPGRKDDPLAPSVDSGASAQSRIAAANGWYPQIQLRLFGTESGAPVTSCLLRQLQFMDSPFSHDRALA